MSDAPRELDAPPPVRIGRYEVVQVLGQGGMGKVLLARDTVLGRRVALKIVRDDLALAPEQRLELFDRMRHEARAAAALSHPNMVTLHDMGEEPAVGLFLVFEHVAGPTLRDRIGGAARLEPREIARMARQLGDALAHAHEAGVIHRDVKPENVLLARSGAKIADFGIARLPDSTLTRAGAVLGTPAYSAPEALADGAFGPASDQFSLAVTLYEAIRGVRAFPGDDALAVAARVANEDPPPLPPSGVFDARGASAALARAMSKDPKKRFASCRDLGEALGIALERRPPLVTPLRSDVVTTTSVTRTSIVPAPQETIRHQNIAAGIAALVILALALMGGRRGAATAKETSKETADESASLKQVSSAFAAIVRAHPKPKAPEPRATHASPTSPARDTREDARSDAGSPTGAETPPPTAPAPSTSAALEAARNEPASAPVRSPADLSADLARVPADPPASINSHGAPDSAR